MPVYTAYGLRLESEIDLPELAGTEALPSCDPVSVRIRKGNVPHDLPDAMTTVEGYQVREDTALFVMTGTARFLITEGESIAFAPEEGHDPSWLRIVLLSGALGILLHQRKLLPLHASAVVSGGVCVAFGGSTGAGKSTLAAGLSKQGLELLTEDKLVVRANGGGWTAWPGVPFLHLFRESARRTGFDEKTQTSPSPRAGKFIHMSNKRFSQTATPLSVLYLVDWSPEGSESKITHLSPTEALFELRAHASLHGLIQALGHEPLFLRWANDLLRDIPVYRFRRPRSYAQFEQGLTLLRAHWTSLT